MNYKLAIALVISTLVVQSCSIVAFKNQKQSSFTLSKVKEDVKVAYPSVRQLGTSALATMLTNQQTVVLLDVREPQEYAVSHLSGAVRVDPLRVANQTPLPAAVDSVRNKTVVLYCSVGVRSSRLAQQLQSDLIRKGAVNVFNLDGGVFAWHNEERPLVNDSGRTEFVHPFDEKYKQLLHRQSLARFKPR